MLFSGMEDLKDSDDFEDLFAAEKKSRKSTKKVTKRGSNAQLLDDSESDFSNDDTNTSSENTPAQVFFIFKFI